MRTGRGRPALVPDAGGAGSRRGAEAGRVAGHGPDGRDLRESKACQGMLVAGPQHRPRTLLGVVRSAGERTFASALHGLATNALKHGLPAPGQPQRRLAATRRGARGGAALAARGVAPGGRGRARKRTRGSSLRPRARAKPGAATRRGGAGPAGAGPIRAGPSGGRGQTSTRSCSTSPCGARWSSALAPTGSRPWAYRSCSSPGSPPATAMPAPRIGSPTCLASTSPCTQPEVHRPSGSPSSRPSKTERPAPQPSAPNATSRPGERLAGLNRSNHSFGTVGAE